MSTSMTHLNGHLLCAIDVETTGLIPAYHDIFQFAVLPLDSQIKPLKAYLPLNLRFQPKREENIDPAAMRAHGIDRDTIMSYPIDAWRAADLFVEWFERLKLPVGKKIAPLAHNWPFDRSFIYEWLGPATFELLFHFHHRDSMEAVLFMNDRADFQSEPIPYPRASLGSVAERLGVVNEHAHDALADCVATAEVYRRLCMKM